MADPITWYALGRNVSDNQSIIEEMQAEQPARVGQVARQLLQHDAGRVGGQQRVRSHARLEARIQFALRGRILEDRLDHEIGLCHAVSGDV